MASCVLIPEEQARKIILENVVPIGNEVVPLEHAHGRILSEDLAAKRTQPPFPASLMDGYAVRQADLEIIPCTLPVAGVSRAGVPFGNDLQAGTAVRIFTGAAVPSGADTIIIQENTDLTNDAEVTIKVGSEIGRFIRPIGLDFNEGDVLLKKQDQLLPQRLALAASMNYASLPVFKRPKVAVISTGDELVPPGERLSDGQIIASNGYAIRASLEQIGCLVLNLGIVRDDTAALSQAVQVAVAEECNLIITLGGASVGDHDLVLPVATRAGFKFEITKVAMRPGKPFLFGKKQTNNHICYFTGLAGNPVSSMIGFQVFVKPLIELLAGKEAQSLGFEQAVLGCDLQANDERAEYMRASLELDTTGKFIATPFPKQDSSMLARFVQAGCLVYRSVKASPASKGEPCQIIRLPR